jgi:branched-subunit amino acid ABC-type transport system permease component
MQDGVSRVRCALAQHILNGLLAGSYYLLIALGLSLIFSLGGIVNLAHGAFYAIGAYLAITIGQRLGSRPPSSWPRSRSGSSA